MKKLTLVVSCTDRKFLPPSPEVQVRNLPAGSVAERSDIWRSRLVRSAARRPLDRLYQGEAWTQVVALASAAARRGFNPRLLVVSAGLGLRDVTSLAPGYSATFAMAKPDSVVGDHHDSHAWWRSLAAQSDALDPDKDLGGRVLLVLSETYASALEPDLHALGQRAGDPLLVGGTRDIPGLPRLPADKALRRALGGTTTGLTLRMARAWLERTEGAPLYSVRLRQSWEAWAREAREPDVYERQPTTDEDVVAVIKQLRASDAKVSKTRALRHLRDTGLACEQHRFASLFERAVGVV